MDRPRFSRLAHRFLPFAAPLDDASVREVLERVPLAEGGRVLDVGCGRAALLLELLQRHAVQGTGVDIDREALRSARGAAEARGCAERITLIEAPALAATLDGPFELTLCVGSSHALGGSAVALEQLARWTRPGGHLLWGEGFWRRDPEPAYLSAISSAKHDLSTHHGNVVAAQQRGWSPIWSAVTSDAGWDRYEGLYRMGMARHLAEHPDDPEADAFRAHSERWYDGYLRWGRDTMGFALYLLERRSAA